jgi:hypothetical protein
MVYNSLELIGCKAWSELIMVKRMVKSNFYTRLDIYKSYLLIQKRYFLLTGLMKNGSSGNGNVVEGEKFPPVGKCFLPVISM